MTLSCFAGLPTPSPTPTSSTCFKCLSGSPPCVDLKKKCDFSKDCTDNSDETACGWPCNFQKDVCGWTNSNQDNFDWRRHKGCTGSFNTGPCKDADNSTSGKLNTTFCFVRLLMEGERAKTVSELSMLMGERLLQWIYSWIRLKKAKK